MLTKRGKVALVAVWFVVIWIGWEWKPFPETVLGRIGFATIAAVSLVYFRAWLRKP